jgi:prophage regulatory protein
MISAAARQFDQLPDSAYVRAGDLVRDPRNGHDGFLGFSKTTFLRMIKEGRFPKPTKLGPRISVWTAGSVREWMASQKVAA